MLTKANMSIKRVYGVAVDDAYNKHNEIWDPTPSGIHLSCVCGVYSLLSCTSSKHNPCLVHR